jgi:hypothetical protein
MLRPDRTWRRLLLAAALAPAACLLLLALRPAPPPIRRANLDQIRPGMDRADVAALLGGPPGDYRRRARVFDATAVVVPAGQPPADEYSLPEEDS